MVTMHTALRFVGQSIFGVIIEYIIGVWGHMVFRTDE